MFVKLSQTQTNRAYGQIFITEFNNTNYKDIYFKQVFYVMIKT